MILKKISRRGPRHRSARKTCGKAAKFWRPPASRVFAYDTTSYSFIDDDRTISIYNPITVDNNNVKVDSTKSDDNISVDKEYENSFVMEDYDNNH
ncbi:hypothetical protein K504DRAFT_468358 [Pleomassaria siparia CBS 279.74]|uniref:Uncharacterized protein n=1 Tax=Pleomassaria siparia CBS 279.74 TaxID=1314801 RepID=A0A6G1JQ98_9PLEO|nr:hypothetical protein K504DRAFT_468358 [Pleomassaria siparia CBS 279.74]